jgi:small GTP-binding protein
MENTFLYDVFLSHSSKDKSEVRDLANRLKKDGLKVWFDEWVLKPGDSIPAKIEEGLEHSRILVLCMSANAFGSDWAQLESGTFRFRDPLNKERRFIPMRLDYAPIKGSLAQFLYIEWYPEKREVEYLKLLETLRPDAITVTPEEQIAKEQFLKRVISMGHTGPIQSVAWSPDGKQVLSGSDDKTLRQWEISSGRCLRVFEGHTDSVWSVAWSPDGKHALSGSSDNTVRLWEISSGRCLLVFEGHTASVWSVAWSPDGKQALSGSEDKTIRQWEISSGHCLRVFEGHTVSVWSVVWSPDGKQALSGSDDKTVRQWEISSGRCLSVFEGHTHRVFSVAWSPDGKQALSGSPDNTVRQWEILSGRCLRVFEGHTASVWSVAWSPDGKQALSGSADKTVRQWEISSGRCLRVFEGHTDSVLSVAWSPDGKQILSGSDDHTVLQWEISSGRCLSVFEGHSYHILSVVWSPDGKQALSVSDDKTVRQWEISSGRCLRVFEGHTNRVLSVAWSPDGKQALSGSYDETVRQWEISSGRCLRVFEGHTNSVLSVAWSPDGKQVLSGSYDRTVRQWEISSGRCLRVFEGHTNSILSVAWNPDGKQVLSGSDDKTIRQWEISSGRCLRVFEGHTASVRSVAWSPDGKQAISGSSDNTVRQWEISSGRCLRVFEGHTDSVWSVAWSPDGKQALSGSSDKTVRQWEISSGRCLRVFEGHTDRVLSVAWSLDASEIFSSAYNGVVHVWIVIETFPGQEIISGIESPKQLQYTNAKVLLVGESGVGKTGLSNYLALGIQVENDRPLPSTDGAWATHWPLSRDKEKTGVTKEIWLWDLAGQVDYRLLHQLYMDDTAAAVLVFNPQNENPFEGLGQWDRDLQKATRKPFAKLLAAARIDRGGLVVSASSMKKFMEERGFVGPLHKTSAKTGEGCDQLRKAILEAIDWESIPETTSPLLYHRLKQEILNMRDIGLVLIRMAELKQRMEMLLRGENFKLAELDTVISLLTGPGMIQRLDFGGFVLLRPEILSRYAAAVVRKVRNHPQELGCIREDELLAGDLDYQDFKRLLREDEVVVLRALLETFISRAWCLRQPSDSTALLIFPSYFRRERKVQPSHPSVLVTYRFTGPADEIYATLVVRLHYTLAFQSTNLWNSAADFRTQIGTKLGFTMTPETEGSSRLEIYFEPDVDENSQVLFLRYVHDHLMQYAQTVTRLRLYFCGDKKCDAFGQAFRDHTKIAKALAPGGKGKVFCSDCGKPIPLRDMIEEKFDSPAVKERVREMQTESQVVIDNESRELLAVHHTGFIVAEAGQIYRGYNNSDHGIDGEIEFKDDLGLASGKRLYLQLKSGDSYLYKRKSDGKEVFQIKNPRWADYWQQQAYTVMLVIRTSDGEIRWMDISGYLKHENTDGKLVKQIPFEGERLDVMSVRRLREKILGRNAS